MTSKIINDGTFTAIFDEGIITIRGD